MSAGVVGVGVRSESVSAALVVRGSIAWRARRAFASSGDIGDNLADLLRELPRPRSRKAHTVVIAVGPGHAQTRRLVGLPDTADADVLTRAVAQNVSRFFLLAAHPVRGSTVVPVNTGQAWAALFDETVLGAIARAVAGTVLRIEAVIPTAFALAAAVEAGALVWRDGDATLHLDVREGALLSLRRDRADGPVNSDASPHWHASLRVLGDEAADFADAYGAALVRVRSSPVALGIGAASDSSGNMASARRLRLPVAAMLVSILAAAVVPGGTAVVAEHVAVGRLRAAPSARADVASIERTTNRNEDALARLADFARARTSRTLALASLAEILPDSCAMVSLQFDSSLVEISVISPRTGDVLEALEADARVTAISLVGPIVRRTGSDQRLEQATIRFHIRAPRHAASLVARSGHPQSGTP